MLVAAWLALGQVDLKRILAYSTVSVLGMLTFLLGLGTSLAVKTAMVLLLAHALYKGALFLAAGSVDHETGTRQITQLGGLVRLMPWTAAAAGLAALSQAGVPPLFGFISKELLYESSLHSPQSGFLTVVALVTSVFLVGVALIVAIRPFFGSRTDTPKIPHEAPWPMSVGPMVLATLSLILGLFPDSVGKMTIAPAVNAIVGEPVAVKLALWHGFTPMLALSGLTLLLGLGVFWFQQPARNLVKKLDFGKVAGPDRGYRFSLQVLERGAGALTRRLQNGSLPRYILIVVLTAIGLIGFSLARDFDPGEAFTWPAGLRFYEIVFPVIIVIATLAAVRARSRLASVAALGVVGFSVAMIYILYGAPDLAMTQFAIETLTVILFVFVLYRLPRFASYTSKATRWRDAIVAVTAGIMMSTLVLVVTTAPLASRLTPFFAENSYTLAKGRNIVNVILVDFRGIDTLGEITVLAVAAIGVFALMKLRTEEKP
jgi:multicomponent Na+:H+ antiporter subunit A